ncbi:hypothetical protein [Sulfuracidifex tepidarius]|uniref:Uncharacterized protein n=1 Tax=Sulfuracidifex tepidarius TaxID=1294262 RepID=A0A510DX03_9CREN|nr:hypothetical protein [Sulfuracidifex tepidarius]BBG24737.1 hypothetical protein IC006_2071 [Sulfuracidifex tepidarius]BBG27526.1 hypothetical protein IC007_2080 [Sulfuracidifex tepidarius]
MPTVRLPLEWYEIIEHVSKNRKEKFAETLNFIVKSEECIGLDYVEPTSFKKIEVSTQMDSTLFMRKIEHFLFCR